MRNLTFTSEPFSSEMFVTLLALVSHHSMVRDNFFPFPDLLTKQLVLCFVLSCLSQSC
jgi:hypothetical protein